MAASIRFEAARAEFNVLMQTMLQIWLGCLGVAVVMWAVLRVTYLRKLTEWHGHAAAVRQREAVDEWAGTRRSVWAAVFHQVERQKEGYAAVAQPLEPYVVVFAVFGIPVRRS
jgi:hypothetical protein